MTVAITAAHHAARLAGTLSFLDSGPQRARLRVYGGARPASPEDPPASDMLVEIALTQPAGALVGNQLALTQQEDGLIVATGVATWARLVNGNNQTAMDMDCSDASGNGDVRLSSTTLYLGGYTRLVSAIVG